MQTQGIEFGELPAGSPRQEKSGLWRRVAIALRERPNEWAKVSTKPSNGAAHSAVHHIRHGMYAGMEEGEFEATVRGVDVWARYVGSSPS